MPLSFRRISVLVLAALLATLLPPTRPAFAQNYTVSSAADTDGTCDATPTNCTLRQAINSAKATVGPDTITFAPAVTLIQPTTPLPALDNNGGITINGDLGGGARVVLNGVQMPTSHGMQLLSGNNTITSMVIINFRSTISAAGGSGIYIQGAAATGNKIYNCYIGVDANGTTAAGNAFYGVFLVDGANDNDIGGTGANQGNVIAANLRGNIALIADSELIANNRIVGNKIGTNAAGTTAPSGVQLSQVQAGIYVEAYARGTVIGPGNIIGGHTTAGGNTVIAGISIGSGSGSLGDIVPRDTKIVGNDIGVNTAGAAVANRVGILLLVGATYGAINTTIGDPANLAGGRNYIAGNAEQGILIQNSVGPFTAGDTIIAGNYIGIDRTNALRPNFGDGIFIGRNGTGAKTIVGPGNIISANKGIGVLIRSSDNVVKGNFIGTSIDGGSSSNSNATTTGLANAGANVLIENGTGNLIGGATTADRNVIAYGGSSGFGNRQAIRIAPGSGFATSGNTVRGNYIGLNAAGNAGLISSFGSVAVTSYGVYVEASSGNTVSGNVIAHVGIGINLFNGSNNNTVSNNLVGTKANGSTAAADKLPLQYDGIRMLNIGASGSSGNTISGNLVANAGAGSISFDLHHGITVVGATSTNNTLTGNTLVNNGATVGNGIRVDAATGVKISQSTTTGNGGAADGIGLVNGGNANRAAPAFTVVSGPPPTISGTVAGCVGCTVEVFTSATLENGEGPIYLTAGSTDGSGAFSINVTGCSRYLTATVTDTSNNTSPFSEPMQEVTNFATACSPGGGFTLGPSAPNAREIAPGQTATYSHLLTNNDNIARTYTIVINSSRGWASAPTTVNVAANSSASFNVTVTAPGGTADGTIDTTTVIARLAGVDSATQTNTTTVKVAAQTPANPAISGAQARSITPTAAAQLITFNHAVTNTGQLAGNFTITAAFVGAANGFTGLSVTPTTINPLNGGASQSVAVQVTAPANAAAGTVSIRITVTVGTVSINVVDTVTVQAVTGFTFTAVAPTARTTPPGVTLVFTHTLVNTGNATDSFQVNVTPQSPLIFVSTTPANPISLAAGASASVQVRVSVPGSTPVTGAGAPYTISVAARRVASAAPTVTNTNQVTVVGGGAPTITPGAASPASAPANAASVVTFVNTLQNTGNAAATFNLATPSVVGSPAGWSANISATTCPTPPATLAQNATCTFTVQVNVPATANGGPQNIAIGATAQNAASVNVSTSAINTVTVAFARSLLFQPTPLSSIAQPAQVLTYTHTLTNTGNGPDSFTLSFSRSDNSWPVTVSPLILSDMARGEARTVRVVVTVPTGAAGNSSMAVSVTATSQGNAAVQASVVDTTTAAERLGALISAGIDQSIESAPAVTPLSFTHLVTNTGNVATSYVVTATNSIASWPAPTVSPSPTLSVAPGQSISVTITVLVPAGTPVGTLNLIDVQVFASGGAVVLDQTQDSVRVGPQYAVLITPKVNLGGVLPNSTAFFTHTLTNIGTRQDTYQLATTDSLGWVTFASPSLVDLGPGASTVITVTIRVPDGLLVATQGFTRVKATSVARPTTVSDQATEQTTVLQQAAVELSPSQFPQVSPTSGEVTLNSLLLFNRGNGRDTFDLTVSSDLGWGVSIDPPSQTLEALSSFPVVQVKVRVPVSITPGTASKVRITATSRFDLTVKAVVEVILTYPVIFVQPPPPPPPPQNLRLWLPMLRKDQHTPVVGSRRGANLPLPPVAVQ